MNTQGKFLEFVTLFGNQYGTSTDSIDRVTEQGKVCVLDLEFEGVVALKKSMLRPTYILISSPSINALQERLAKSHNIDANDPMVAKWVDKAKAGHYQDGDYDINIINDDLEKAYAKLKDYCLSLYWQNFDEED
ncbi:hypothetical protein HDU91_003110 [Kappamyces sp. JEL0680]|nr:hypothetical protein HDU91_003110 [Kappamyces sp. JEL0680]